jgi:hypothetical protein
MSQDNDYINPPDSPIPPLTKLPGHEKIPLAFSRICRYCDKVQLIIERERIQDDRNGRQRFRHIPRDLDGNIHSCRRNFNDTKEESEIR